MANSIIILNKLIVLFVFIFIGYYAYKKTWVDERGSAAIAKLITAIFNPALMLSTAVGYENRPSSHLLLQNALLSIIVFASLIALSPLLARILRVPSNERNMVTVMLTFGNNGFLGVPLVTALYGKGAAIYLVFYIICFNMLFYSMAQHIFKTKAGDKTPFSIRSLASPGMLAGFVAIAFVIMDVNPPVVVVDCLSTMGDACIILSMIVTGFALAKIDLRTVFTDIRTLAYTAFKMLILPVAAAFIIRNVNLPVEPMLLGIMVLMYGVPSGSLPVIGCEQYGIDGTMLNRAYALTTLVSLITLPIATMLII